MSRFAQIWAGEREPRLRVLPTLISETEQAGPIAERYRQFAHARLAQLPSASSRLDLDRVKIRLCDRLAKELRLAGNSSERGALFVFFVAALDEIEERGLEVEPAELVERVIVREPAPGPLSPRQAMGLFIDET